MNLHPVGCDNDVSVQLVEKLPTRFGDPLRVVHALRTGIEARWVLGLYPHSTEVGINLCSSAALLWEAPWSGKRGYQAS